MIVIYAPKVSDDGPFYPSAHLFGVKGGKTRWSGMDANQPSVTIRSWGYPHADHDRDFGWVMDLNQQNNEWGA